MSSILICHCASLSKSSDVKVLTPQGMSLSLRHDTFLPTTKQKASYVTGISFLVTVPAAQNKVFLAEYKQHKYNLNS